MGFTLLPHVEAEVEGILNYRRFDAVPFADRYRLYDVLEKFSLGKSTLLRGQVALSAMPRLCLAHVPFEMTVSSFMGSVMNLKSARNHCKDSTPQAVDPPATGATRAFCASTHERGIMRYGMYYNKEETLQVRVYTMVGNKKPEGSSFRYEDLSDKRANERGITNASCILIYKCPETPKKAVPRPRGLSFITKRKHRKTGRLQVLPPDTAADEAVPCPPTPSNQPGMPGGPSNGLWLLVAAAEQVEKKTM